MLALSLIGVPPSISSKTRPHRTPTPHFLFGSHPCTLTLRFAQTIWEITKYKLSSMWILMREFLCWSNSQMSYLKIYPKRIIASLDACVDFDDILMLHVEQYGLQANDKKCDVKIAKRLTSCKSGCGEI